MHARSLYSALYQSHDHNLSYVHARTSNEEEEEEEPERRKTCKESSGMPAKPAHLHNAPDS